MCFQHFSAFSIFPETTPVSICMALSSFLSPLCWTRQHHYAIDMKWGGLKESSRDSVLVLLAPSSSTAEEPLSVSWFFSPEHWLKTKSGWMKLSGILLTSCFGPNGEACRAGVFHQTNPSGTVYDGYPFLISINDSLYFLHMYMYVGTCMYVCVGA